MTDLRNGYVSLARIALGLAAACGLQANAGSPTYKVTELGTLGGAQSGAYGLNESNHVVGWSHTASGAIHAFVWIDGVMTDLGTLGGPASRAWAINDADVIVGEAHPTGQSGDGGYRAFIYQNQQMTALPTLGGTWSAAYDINTDGVIAGLSTP